MEELKQLLLQLQKAKHLCCAHMISRPRTFHRVKNAEHQQDRQHQFAIVGDDRLQTVPILRAICDSARGAKCVRFG